MTRRWLAILALLFTAAAWGATFTLVKNAVTRMTPEAFIFWRFTLAGLILIVAVRRRLSRAMLVPGLLLGLLVFIGYWMQTTGLLTISAPRSAFLTGLYVVMVPFFQARTVRPKLNVWIAAILAVIGTTILIGGGFDARPTFGDLLTLACAIAFAWHVVLSSRWSTNETSAALAGVQVLVVGIAAAPFAALSKATPWDASLVTVIVFTAVVTTALAFVALMWGQAHVSATEAAVILSFEPVAAAITSIVFEGDPLTLTFAVGAAFILGAMLLSQMR
ncbi:MAG TPA: DMT family transporter [Thermoanaerobaculia bacterium]|jgi:drug/metabolite transporter (DMT)-like permease